MVSNDRVPMESGKSGKVTLFFIENQSFLEKVRKFYFSFSKFSKKSGNLVAVVNSKVYLMSGDKVCS